MLCISVSIRPEVLSTEETAWGLLLLLYWYEPIPVLDDMLPLAEYDMDISVVLLTHTAVRRSRLSYVNVLVVPLSVRDVRFPVVALKVYDPDPSVTPPRNRVWDDRLPLESKVLFFVNSVPLL